METERLAHTVEEHLAGKAPVVRAIYERLIDAVRAFGPLHEEPKKTSIHLNHRTAFAGIATQQQALLLTIRAASPIESPRVRANERVSAKRVHALVKLERPEDVDAELVGWLRAGYDLST